MVNTLLDLIKALMRLSKGHYEPLVGADSQSRELFQHV